MRKFLMLLTGFFLPFTVSSQGCLPNGIIFSSQAQIDNFQTDYPNCTQIEGDVTISGNDISNLYGLNVLTSVGGYLNIYGNTALVSLQGLDNINSNSITNLTIYGNTVLTKCGVQSVCNFLARLVGVIDIENNASGCNNPQEVEASCASIYIYPNPSSTQITVETIENTYEAIISIMNVNGKEVIHQQITESKTVIDITSLPSGFYFARLILNGSVEVRKMIKL